jgi:hypothetical protein
MRVGDAGRLLGMQSNPMRPLLQTIETPDEKTIRDWIERLPQRADEGASVQLSIADAVSDAFSGVIHLHSLDWQSRRCEVRFWVIPEQRHRGVRPIRGRGPHRRGRSAGARVLGRPSVRE